MLNAICWVAKVEIPADGVRTPRPPSQMEANLQGDVRRLTPDRIRQTISV